MFAELLSMFHTSPQGQGAMQALQNQGMDPQHFPALMNMAMPAAANAMHQAAANGHPTEPTLGLFNILGGHAGTDFLTGAVAGLLRGDGFMGSIQDGLMGMVGGHIAEVVAQRTGMNQQAAGQIAAVLTPFVVHYVHERLSSHPTVTAQHGYAPPRPGFQFPGG